MPKKVTVCMLVVGLVLILIGEVRAQESLAALEALPLAAKQTSDHHWSLMRAARAAGDVGGAADALATFHLLREDPPRDVSDVQQWLHERALLLHQEAQAELAAGRQATALRSYLLAIRCDAAILGGSDDGLRTAASSALDRLARGTLARPDQWFHLAFLEYEFGNLRAALHALDEYLRRETDPYRKWRGQVWLDHIAAEQKEEEDAEKRGHSVSGPSPWADLPPSAGDVGKSPAKRADAHVSDGERAAARAYLDARRGAVRAQLDRVDDQMANLTKYTRGRPVVTTGGRVVIATSNQREVRSELESLQQTRAHLQSQLDALE